MIKTETFLLPTHWASYLINGDPSSFNDEEWREVRRWERDNAPGPCIDCADMGFLWRGDDSTLGCDRSEFVFQVIEPVLADGEVVGHSL
jgi:hypothetical protein